MKVLGLDLDNSPHIAQDKSLRYAKNITIDNKGQSYFNERGFDFIGELDDILENHPTNRHIIPYIYSDADNHKYNIIGTIPTNVGVVLFCVVEHWNNVDNVVFIVHPVHLDSVLIDQFMEIIYIIIKKI